MSAFWIVVYADGKYYRMSVELIYRSNQIEKYKVIAGGKELILQSNQPLFESRGLKHRKGQWKLLKGEYKNQGALKSITETIQAFRDLHRRGY